MSKKFLLLALFIASISMDICLEAQQTKTHQYDFNENDLIFSYEIPEDFKSIKYGVEPEKDNLVLNYIAKNETAEIWTELRQICYMPVSADDPIGYFKFLKNAFDPEDKSPIQTSVEHEINICWCILDHPCPRVPNHPTKTASIFGTKLFNGKNVTWAVQNSIMYDPKTITQDQKEELVERVEDFFKNCKVIKKQ